MELLFDTLLLGEVSNQEPPDPDDKWILQGFRPAIYAAVPKSLVRGQLYRVPFER
jgi:hypothetical protein